MAVPDLEKIVKIIFAGDDTDLGKTITSVGGGLDALGAKVGKATQPFADLTDTIIKIDAVLAALAVGALVVATKAAGDFSDSFAEISTLIDVPKDKLSDFSDQILDYAIDSTQSIDDINSSIYNAISAGEDYTTSLQLLEQAEQLGIGTKADLNTAINILKPTLNAFGLSTKEAADFADILFVTVKSGKTTLSELEPVLANVTGIASASGVSFDQVAAALAGLTAAGLPTNLAVTQLKGALTGIFAPAEGAAKVAKELGIEFGKNALEGKTLNEVFALMVEKTGGTLEGMKALIPRVEGASAALVLGADTGGKYAIALDNMADRAGQAAIAYEKMKDNFELTNQKLINNLQSTLIAAGLPLLDEWGKLAAGIVSIFQGVKVGFDSGAFDPLYDVVIKLTTDLGQYFDDIGEALPEALEGIDWSGFTSALDDLVDTGKNLLDNLFGGLDLTKPEDLEIAIQKVVDTFENWVKLTEGLVEGLEPFITKIGELASKFTEMDGETLKIIGTFNGFATGINKIANIVPSLTAPLNLLSGSIGLLSLTRLPAAVTALGGFGGAAATLAAGSMPLLLAGATALAGGWYIGSKIGKDIPILGSAGTAFGNLAFAIANLGDDTVESMEEQAAHTAELAKAALEMVRTKEAAGELASQIEQIPPISLTTDFESIQGDFEGINQEITDLVNKGEIVIQATLEDDQFNEDWNFIEKIAADGTVTRIALDSSGAVIEAKETNEKIEKELTDKQIEITLQGEIDIELANIKAQAETLQTFFEWEAKVEIADIEADVEKFVAVAELAEAAWQSTADVISAALGALSGDLSGLRWLDVIDIIDREQDIREGLAEQLILLQQAQIDLINARTQAIAKGEGVITITTDGLEPELEQVLYSIVQKAQVKANEEGFNALLGI